MLVAECLQHTVAVRPFRHDEYERFITAAYLLQPHDLLFFVFFFFFFFFSGL